LTCQSHHVVEPEVNVVEPEVIESCHSIWLFDHDHMLFLRVLKGSGSNHLLAATGWRRYYGLEVVSGSESFLVLLNAEGTRLLRSWRHTKDCAQCGEHATSELSVDQVRSLARVSGASMHHPTAAIPTTGALNAMSPEEPRKNAAPKLKMPPSAATSQ